MTTIPYSPTEVSALRKEMSLHGITINQKQAWTILRRVGHRGVCVDALLQQPRPEWVAAILAPVAKP